MASRGTQLDLAATTGLHSRKKSSSSLPNIAEGLGKAALCKNRRETSAHCELKSAGQSYQFGAESSAWRDRARVLRSCRIRGGPRMTNHKCVMQRWRNGWQFLPVIGLFRPGFLFTTYRFSRFAILSCSAHTTFVTSLASELGTTRSLV
jgi:hypothetical protein